LFRSRRSSLCRCRFSAELRLPAKGKPPLIKPVHAKQNFPPETGGIHRLHDREYILGLRLTQAIFSTTKTGEKSGFSLQTPAKKQLYQKNYLKSEGRLSVRLHFSHSARFLTLPFSKRVFIFTSPPQEQKNFWVALDVREFLLA
jgi:hypothetical protein